MGERMKILKIAFFCSALLHFAGGAFAQTTLERAIALYDEGNVDEARPLFERSTKEDPGNGASHYYLGVISISSGSWEDAIDYLEKAAELDKMNARYQLMLGNAYGLKAQNAGILKKFGAASDCRKHYERAVELDSAYVEARSNLLEYYLQAPGIMGGSVAKAKTQADEIMKLDSCQGHLAAGRIHNYEKEPEEEEVCYRKAVEAGPGRLLAYQALWYFYMNNKRGSDAEALFSKALTALSDKTEICYMAGLYYVQEKDFARARDLFGDMLRIDSSKVTACYQLGKVALLSGEDLERGLDYFERYLTVKPRKGDPAWSQTHWRMGMIEEKLGRKDRARSEYLKALELNPKLSEAGKALKELK